MDPDAAIPVRAMTGQDSLESAFWRKRLAADDWEREAERFLKCRVLVLRGARALNRRGRFLCRSFQTCQR